MRQGGDDSALHIANVDIQYQDAVLVNFEDPLEDIYIELRADFPVAAVVPPAHLALPTLHPSRPQQHLRPASVLPAPVFTVAAEDFYQEEIKAKAHQRLQYIRHRLSLDRGIARAFHRCAVNLANAATAACHELYLAAINKLPSQRTFFDARQILWRHLAVRTTETRALHAGSLIELGVHSREPFDPCRPALASHYKKTRLEDVDTIPSSKIQDGDGVGQTRHQERAGHQ